MTCISPLPVGGMARAVHDRIITEWLDPSIVYNGGSVVGYAAPRTARSPVWHARRTISEPGGRCVVASTKCASPVDAVEGAGGSVVASRGGHSVALLLWAQLLSTAGLVVFAGFPVGQLRMRRLAAARASPGAAPSAQVYRPSDVRASRNGMTSSTGGWGPPQSALYDTNTGRPCTVRVSRRRGAASFRN